MKTRQSAKTAGEIMDWFALSTGLTDDQRPPRRYLWTDAFAVCTFLGLHRHTGMSKYRKLALDLVDQVHWTLGRHRPDDTRRGWISGSDAARGGEHPTAGGLRIGKKLRERKPDEALDERLEWELSLIHI